MLVLVIKLLLQFDFLAPSGATRNAHRALDAERAALAEVDSVVARLHRPAAGRRPAA